MFEILKENDRRPQFLHPVEFSFESKTLKHACGAREIVQGSGTLNALPEYLGFNSQHPYGRSVTPRSDTLF